MKELELNQKKKKKRFISESSEEDRLANPPVVSYGDYSNGEEEIAKNACLACHGSDRQNIGDAWIGCNKCASWFHRDCLSIDIENKRQEEIKEFSLICRNCSKVYNAKIKRTL